MPSSEHEQYQEQLIDALRRFAHQPDLRRRMDQCADAIAVLYHLDLEAARLIIRSCYAASARGTRPWQPITVFRAILLGHLIKQPRFSSLSAALRGCSVLRAIAGFSQEDQQRHAQPAPAASTFYDFCNRLLDGPHSTDRAISNSALQTQRTKIPRRPQQRRDRKEEKADKRGVTKGTEQVSEKLRKRLLAARDAHNADDLNTRLGHILLSCAVVESAKRGLLGTNDALDISGDGSPLPTAAHGLGKRCCDCPKRQRCNCPRLFSDPDACLGFDSYRKSFFFGHHFYELGVYTNGSDLPLHVRLDPGNETDHTASLKAVDWLCKAFRDDYLSLRAQTFIADAGHDGAPVYRFAHNWSLLTVIPLTKQIPASHPSRGEVKLSKRGIPLCQANVEMARRGSAGSPRRALFICPLRAKKIKQCPLAPASQPDWHCTGMKWGPTVTIASKDDPRLFPHIQRGSARYKRLYAQRSGTERSNNVKKNGGDVLRCRHRRAHLWHIRLVAVALLQHAKAWTRGLDRRDFIADLIGQQEVAA